MKVLLDLKPLQGENRYHGIGRVTYELSYRLIKKLDKPWALITNQNREIGAKLRKTFSEINPHLKFEVLHLEDFSLESSLTYELLLEWKVSQINPDVYFIFSFFEWDNPTSMKKLSNKWQNFIIAYDLIPYLFQDLYLNKEHFKVWYFRKLEEFKKADFFFAISETTKEDLIKYLDIPEEKIIVIPLGCDESFRPLSEKELLESKRDLVNLGIKKDFILYVPSGFDLIKNIDRLIKAYSLLDKSLREKYQLVIASKIDELNLNKLKSYAKDLGVGDNVIFTGYVSDEILVKLYNLCSLFVYPSLYEGFGLPVLEASKCGAPVICSNNSAPKDIIQIKEALFDPYKVEEIAEKIHLALIDENYRKLLAENAKKQSERFSWDIAVDIILNTMKEKIGCLLRN